MANRVESRQPADLPSEVETALKALDAADLHVIDLRYLIRYDPGTAVDKIAGLYRWKKGMTRQGGQRYLEAAEAVLRSDMARCDRTLTGRGLGYLVSGWVAEGNFAKGIEILREYSQENPCSELPSQALGDFIKSIGIEKTLDLLDAGVQADPSR